MKIDIVNITGTAVLSLLFAVACPADAAQEHQGDRQYRNGTQQNSPAPQQQQDHRQGGQRGNQQPLAPQQPQAERQQERTQDARTPHQQENQRGSARETRGSDRSSNQERPSGQSSWGSRQTTNWPKDHRSWQQRGGYKGYRIPDSRFRGYFGQQHGFRVGRLPFLFVGGYPRFQYGGYWFSVLDPYPAYWAGNWYDTDDVYVAYLNDGYYLYNRKYPGVGLAVSVTF